MDCRGKDADGNDLYSSEDIEKHFYSFLMEKVGEAYRNCIESHRDRIAEIVEGTGRELASALGIDDLSKAAKAPSVETDIIDIALENYDDIRNNIVKDIKTVYQDLETKAAARLDSLYQYQVEMGREALNQAQQLMMVYDNDEIRQTLVEAKQMLAEPQRILAESKL